MKNYRFPGLLLAVLLIIPTVAFSQVTVTFRCQERLSAGPMPKESAWVPLSPSIMCAVGVTWLFPGGAHTHTYHSCKPWEQTGKCEIVIVPPTDSQGRSGALSGKPQIFPLLTPTLISAGCTYEFGYPIANYGSNLINVMHYYVCPAVYPTPPPVTPTLTPPPTPTHPPWPPYPGAT